MMFPDFISILIKSIMSGFNKVKLSFLRILNEGVYFIHILTHKILSESNSFHLCSPHFHIL